MHTQRPLRLAIIGAAGRGGHYGRLCAAVGGVEVAAVCDLDADAVERSRIESGAREGYTDYAQLLRQSDCQAVLIATPMHLHAVQSIAALATGRHVLSEVTAAISLAECHALRAAVRANPAQQWMMAENYGYQPEKMLVSGLVRQGLFGDPYYAEGQYVHELKSLIEQTTWRRHWQVGLPGLTYPTHSLGPILDWFHGDRIDRLTVADSGSHHRDPRGQPYHHDTATILAKTVAGRLIELRQDLISDRPHDMARNQLQGTDGCYDQGRIWCRSLHRTPDFQPIEALLRQRDIWDRYLPDWYRENWEVASASGHGGGDWYVLRQFVQTVAGEIANPCDIDHALDLTLPGLVSQQPDAAEHWLQVPDSRTW